MHISILGLGLIGGSLGLALKKADPSLTVTGYARRRETLDTALHLGAIDRAAVTPAEAAHDADVVVIATPVLAVRDMMSAIRDHIKPGTIVSDVASTKAEVMKWAAEILPSTTFIGGHPMAGKEKAGIEAVEAALFQKSLYCLTPATMMPGPERAPLGVLSDLANKAGARVLVLDAADHDRLAAGISHLPFLLSAMLVSATTNHPDWSRMSLLASTGYRDLTRLASGDTTLYRDICLTNRDAILAWLDDFGKELARFRSLLAEDVPGLERALAQAKEARELWLKSRR